MVKVRIKEKFDGRDIIYSVQYKKYLLFWIQYDWWPHKESALNDAKKLYKMLNKKNKIYTIEEFEEEIKNEKEKTY